MKSYEQTVLDILRGKDIAEASYSAKAARAGEDIGKPGKMFSKIAASAAKRYGSKEAGERIAGAILKKQRMKEDEDYSDEQIEQILDEEESKGESEAEFQARQKRLAAAHKETQKNPDRLARMMKIPGYADAMKLAQKTTQKEEVEINEGKYNDNNLYSIHKDTGKIQDLGNPYRDHSPNMRKAELEKQGHKVVTGSQLNRPSLLNKEETELEEALIHPMGVHVQRVPGKMKNGQEVYKVHAVGSKVTAVKPGEHLNDTELDDATESGHKIKMMREEKQPMTPPFEPGKTSKPVTPGKYGQEVSKVKHLAKQAMPNTQKEEVEKVDQTIIEHKAFDIDLPETLRFGDYLTAAKKLVESEDDAIAVANEFFKNQDESLVIESFTRADIEDKVKAHQRAGHEVSMPKYSTKEGKPYAEYTVTNKETGKKTKYIHHGSTRRVVT